jgi:multiple sugar transport system substrate-binding protein
MARVKRPAVGLLLVALAALAGCGLHGASGADDRAGKPVVLRFWGFGREAEVVSALLPDFEASHPGIKVEVQQLALTAAHAKFLTAIAGDATPDLAQLGNTWLPELVALKAVLPLDRLQRASAGIAQADYFPEVWRTNQVEGILYGIPWYVDTRLLFYRRDILAQAGYDRPPRDWAEWLAQMRAIKKLVGPDRYAALLPLNEFEPLQVLALQQPEPMLRDGGRYGNFSSPSFRRALGFYRQLFAEQLAPTQTNQQISNVWDEMGKGYFSFYISGPWNIGEFKRRLPPSLQGAWMTAPMPGPDGPGASSVGGSSLVVFRRSRHPEAAWQLIEFLSRPDIQQRFYEECGDLPPRRSSWERGTIASDPYTAAFRTQLEHLQPFVQLPEWEQVMQEMRVMAERVATGTQEVDAATTEFDAEVDGMLEKRRWLLDRAARRAPAPRAAANGAGP